MARRNQEFQTIRSEGGLLPADLLRRVLERSSNLAGTRPEDYGLPAGERLNEAITQSWNRLRRHWAEFREASANLPDNEAGTGLTNDRWNLPLLRELGFGLLPTSAGPEIEGRTYAISRFFGPVPVHLIGCGLSLDRRARGQRGAAAANPHGLVQEFLNRSDAHLWALLSNGLRLRVLRDNQALSRQSFLEFDLEAMFNGEVYSDFVLLWLVAHATRFTPREGDRPETCWLEQWTREAEEQGTRALGDLRRGVEQALAILGEGFTSHARNTALRDALRSGQLSPTELHAQLLRLVYRLIFLFVAEDRTLEGQSLLHPRDDTEAARSARDRYAAHYSTARLREMASKIKGSRHGDLWQQFKILIRALSGDAKSETVRQQLALPALGSFLWDPASTAALNDAELTNFDLLEALRNLAFTRQGKVLRPVDYKNLGAEELGGVYESLLALTPQVSGDGARFSFAEFAGNERKTSGSYYTPDSLVQCLLDSALDPVVEEAVKGKSPADAEQAILALKVCDPAVGSGHFLVGAGHRLARHLARCRALAEGESEPSPLLYQHALRDVIGHCLYGVDVNPMAAELCRVSLWLEALEPGKPLTFLDHHIQCGDSLVGVLDPKIITQGIPDEAYKPLTGDDREICNALKKRNREAENRARHGDLFVREAASHYRASTVSLDDMPEESLADIATKRERWHRLHQDPDYLREKHRADLFTAAFFAPKTRATAETVPVTEDLLALAEGQPPRAWVIESAENVAARHRFFHWHLGFPEITQRGGFDVVLGNPPWEVSQLGEEEYFAAKAPHVASLKGAQRKAAIAALGKDSPRLWAAYREDLRTIEATNAFVRGSGRYPLTAYGKLNLYALFAEHAMRLINLHGRVGIIVQSGIATDDGNKAFFEEVSANGRLVSFFDMVNLEGIFPGIHRTHPHFCLMTLAAPHEGRVARLSFYNTNTGHLTDARRIFTLSPDDILRINPNTKTAPVFRSQADAELTKKIYARVPVLIDETKGKKGNPWGISFRQGLFNMTSDSGLFRTWRQLEDAGARREGANWVEPSGAVWLPLYEAKMIHQFDHRWATYETDGETSRDVTDVDKRDPVFEPLPRYWVPQREVEERLRAKSWTRGWLMGWRDITNATNERTVIAGVVPRSGVGHTLPIFFVDGIGDIQPRIAHLANWNSLVFDFVARQKVGGTHLTYSYLKQFPVLPPSAYGQAELNFIVPRVLELTYTSHAMKPFAEDLGYDGPPFAWNPDRRARLRAELDAYYARLYGLTRDELRYILDPTDVYGADYPSETFRVLKNNEVKQFGEYRTRRLVLEVWDRLERGELAAPSPAIRIAAGRTETVEVTHLPDGAWARPMHDPRAETGTQLVAILKAMGGPLSARQVRLAALLALEPRLLLPYLDEEDAANWQRLIGSEADPLPPGTSSFIARADAAWGAAVRNLRTNGHLIEDILAGTWAPGAGLDRFATDGWPDGRARMVLQALHRQATDTVVAALPTELRDWVDAAAA